MPLQNRVDPFGTIHAAPERGLFTGNRGVIHDPATKTLLRRRWTTKAWIVCECSFRGRRREVMGRNTPSGNAGWTELFFLDEATALAAGHRPCFYCRREAAQRFAACFAAGRGTERLSAPDMDAILHRERLTPMPERPLLRPAEVAGLPNGAMVAYRGKPHLVLDGEVRRWRFAGYGEPLWGAALVGDVKAITPPATIAALVGGYGPLLHATALD